MKRLSSAITFFIILTVSFLILLLSIALKTPTPTHYDNQSQNTVATINIHLQDTTLDTILSGSKDTKYKVSSLDLTNDGTTTTFDNLEIKGRGNSTWYENKKPFQIKFKNKTDLLGLGNAHKFVLLADAFDPSHLKNSTAFYLEKILKQKNPIDSSYVNLYFDDEYYGLYLLTDKVELGMARINLLSPTAILVEHEGLHAHLEEKCYQTIYTPCLVVKDVKDGNPAIITSFLQKFEELEKAAEQYDYEKVKELADLDSFAKYYLLSNFTLNPDAFMSSYYFYQDIPNGKIHVGPGWDFDLAFNSENVRGANYGINYFSPYDTGASDLFTKERSEYISPYGESESLIMYYLIHMPEFQAKVRELYNRYLYGHSDELMAYIDSTATLIRDYAVEDNTKWQFDDFDESVENLKDWIRERYDYLDSYYSNRPNIPESQIVEL